MENLFLSKIKKIYSKILSGLADSNIRFQEIQPLLNKLGFDVRIKGDHYIYTKDNIDEILNLQPKSGKAKAYKIKQIREIIQKYHLTIEGKDEESL